MGTTITLVSFDRTFLDKSFVWCNDPEIMYLIDGAPISKEDQEKWFNNLPYKENYKIWGILCNNVPIGACGLRNIEGDSGFYFGYIGEKEYWGGLGCELVSKVEEKALKHSIRNIYIAVLHDNPRAIHVYEKMGYVEYDRDARLIYYKKKLR